MDFIQGEVLCIDKPLGWTSFDAVKRIRGALTRRLGIKKIKVGHAGTLDPLATGVMIITTGRATRRIEELQAGVKEYVATLAIGATTPSFDLETDIDAVYPAGHVTEESLRSVLAQFTGRIEQIPPGYSAVKIDGERAYQKIRRGDEPELKPKVLVIDSMELLSFTPAGPDNDNDAYDADKAVANDADNTDAACRNTDTMINSRHIHRRVNALHCRLATAQIRVVCSKGTYIRALARDIGAALGSGAHLTDLRRTRVGNIGIDDCLSVDRLAELIATTPLEFPDDYQFADRAKPAKQL